MSSVELHSKILKGYYRRASRVERSHNKRFLSMLEEHCKNVMLIDLDVICNMKEAVQELMSVRKLLISKRNRCNKLMKLGLACLAFPEPIVSNIIGGVLLTLGYCVEKAKKDGNLMDMVEAVRELKRLIASSHIIGEPSM